MALVADLQPAIRKLENIDLFARKPARRVGRLQHQLLAATGKGQLMADMALLPAVQRDNQVESVASIRMRMLPA